MSKKRNRSRTAHAAGATAPRPARRRKRRLNLPSLLFLALILLGAATVVIAWALDDDRPECPPGLVWSEAHAHCH